MVVAREFWLSNREAEVLNAAAEGRSIKQIAFELSLSRKTVEYYWTQLFKKVDRRSQIEVLAVVLSRACAEREDPGNA